MGEACAELVGAADAKPADQQIKMAIHWYIGHALPHITKALAAKQTEMDGSDS